MAYNSNWANLRYALLRIGHTVRIVDNASYERSIAEHKSQVLQAIEEIPLDESEFSDSYRNYRNKGNKIWRRSPRLFKSDVEFVKESVNLGVSIDNAENTFRNWTGNDYIELLAGVNESKRETIFSYIVPATIKQEFEFIESCINIGYKVFKESYSYNGLSSESVSAWEPHQFRSLMQRDDLSVAEKTMLFSITPPIMRGDVSFIELALEQAVTDGNYSREKILGKIDHSALNESDYLHFIGSPLISDGEKQYIFREASEIMRGNMNIIRVLPIDGTDSYNSITKSINFSLITEQNDYLELMDLFAPDGAGKLAIFGNAPEELRGSMEYVRRAFDSDVYGKYQYVNRINFSLLQNEDYIELLESKMLDSDGRKVALRNMPKEAFKNPEVISVALNTMEYGFYGDEAEKFQEESFDFTEWTDVAYVKMLKRYKGYESDRRNYKRDALFDKVIPEELKRSANFMEQCVNNDLAHLVHCFDAKGFSETDVAGILNNDGFALQSKLTVFQNASDDVHKNFALINIVLANAPESRFNESVYKSIDFGSLQENDFYKLFASPYISVYSKDEIMKKAPGALRNNIDNVIFALGIISATAWVNNQSVYWEGLAKNIDYANWTSDDLLKLINSPVIQPNQSITFFTNAASQLVDERIQEVLSQHRSYDIASPDFESIKKYLGVVSPGTDLSILENVMVLEKPADYLSLMKNYGNYIYSRKTLLKKFVPESIQNSFEFVESCVNNNIMEVLDNIKHAEWHIEQFKNLLSNEKMPNQFKSKIFSFATDEMRGQLEFIQFAIDHGCREDAIASYFTYKDINTIEAAQKWLDAPQLSDNIRSNSFRYAAEIIRSDFNFIKGRAIKGCNNTFKGVKADTWSREQLVELLQLDTLTSESKSSLFNSASISLRGSLSFVTFAIDHGCDNAAVLVDGGQIKTVEEAYEWFNAAQISLVNKIRLFQSLPSGIPRDAVNFVNETLRILSEVHSDDKSIFISIMNNNYIKFDKWLPSDLSNIILKYRPEDEYSFSTLISNTAKIWDADSIAAILTAGYSLRTTVLPLLKVSTPERIKYFADSLNTLGTKEITSKNIFEILKQHTDEEVVTSGEFQLFIVEKAKILLRKALKNEPFPKIFELSTEQQFHMLVFANYLGCFDEGNLTVIKKDSSTTEIGKSQKGISTLSTLLKVEITKEMRQQMTKEEIEARTKALLEKKVETLSKFSTQLLRHGGPKANAQALDFLASNYRLQATLENYARERHFSEDMVMELGRTGFLTIGKPYIVKDENGVEKEQVIVTETASKLHNLEFLAEHPSYIVSLTSFFEKTAAKREENKRLLQQRVEEKRQAFEAASEKAKLSGEEEDIREANRCKRILEQYEKHGETVEIDWREKGNVIVNISPHKQIFDHNTGEFIGQTLEDADLAFEFISHGYTPATAQQAFDDTKKKIATAKDSGGRSHILSAKLEQKSLPLIADIEAMAEQIDSEVAEVLIAVHRVIQADMQCRYEFMDKFSGSNAIVGAIVGKSCDRIDGAGSNSFTIPSIIDPNVQHIAIYRESRIIAKAVMRVSPEAGVALMNALQDGNFDNLGLETDITAAFMRAAHDFAIQYNQENPATPITQIHTGMCQSESPILSGYVSSTLPRATEKIIPNGFYNADTQYVLYRTNDELTISKAGGKVR